MIYHKIHMGNPHELCGSVSSNLLHEKMIFHKIHICSLFGLHALCGCVSLIFLLQKRICHRIHICNLCGLHELCRCVSSKCLPQKIIFMTIMNCVFVCLQISCSRKWFTATRISFYFEWYLYIKNLLSCLQIRWNIATEWTLNQKSLKTHQHIR